MAQNFCLRKILTIELNPIIAAATTDIKCIPAWKGTQVEKFFWESLSFIKVYKIPKMKKNDSFFAWKETLMCVGKIIILCKTN